METKIITGRGGPRGGGRPRKVDIKKLKSMKDLWEKIGRKKLIALLQGKKVKVDKWALGKLMEVYFMREQASAKDELSIDDIFGSNTKAEEPEVVSGESDQDQVEGEKDNALQTEESPGGPVQESGEGKEDRHSEG